MKASLAISIDTLSPRNVDTQIGRPSTFNHSGFSIVELIVVMAIVSLLLALAIPAIGRARQAARRTQCLSNLRNIAFGLTQHDHFNKRLPASGSYRVDPDKTYRLHTWAVTILPYLDQNNLFNQLDLDRPIEDPANEAIRTAQVPNYVCPVDLTRNPERVGDLSRVPRLATTKGARSPESVGYRVPRLCEPCGVR